MRKILLTVLVALLSVLVLRLARRQPEGTTLLLALLALQAATPASTRNTPKTSATSARVDKVIASLGTLHTGSGTTSTLGVGAQNTSYSVSGQNTSTPDGNTGSTWATGERGYINNVVTSVGILFGAFNALQASYSNTCAVITTMQNTLNGWHSVLQNAGVL